MPSETLQIIIEAQNRASSVLAQTVRDIERLNAEVRKLGHIDVSNTINSMRSLGDASTKLSEFARVLDMFRLGRDVGALNHELLNVSQSGKWVGTIINRLGAVAGLTGTAIIGLTTVTAKAAKELGDYGQVVIQTERRFQAFAGDAERAADILMAVRKATDNGISSMYAMQYSALLMSMGLAEGSARTAELIRLATMLGPSWRTAEENIQDFTMLLANQSIRRLDQFGLSISEVKKRQKELIEQGLASDLAFTNAILEVGTEKMRDLERAGVRAAIGTRQLQTAIMDLRAEFSKLFASPVGTAESGLAKIVRDATQLLQSFNTDPLSRMSNLQAHLQELEELRARIVSGQASWMTIGQTYVPPPSLETIDKFIAETRAEIAYLSSTTKDWGESASDAGVGVAAAMQRVKQSVDNLNAAYEDNLQLLGQITTGEKLAFLDENIATTTQSIKKLRSEIYQYNELLNQQKTLLAAGNTHDATQIERIISNIDIDELRKKLQDAELALRTLSERRIQIQAEVKLIYPPDMFQGIYFGETIPYRSMLPLPLDPWRLFLNRQAEPGQYGAWYNEPPTAEEFKTVLAGIQSSAADDTSIAFQQAADATQNAFIRVANEIGGKFDQVITFSTRLRDFRIGGGEGLWAPGANGPFEDIYRLQAWLTDNSWSDVAARFGITSKEQGLEIIRKFQTGLWDESVTRMIDEESIKNAILTEQQAEAYKKAFAERIAGITGVGTDVVAATIYGSDYINENARGQRLVDAGQNMAGNLITGIKKAEPDLWQAGYNAAMAMQSGWNAARANQATMPDGAIIDKNESDKDYLRAGRTIGMY